MKSFYRRRCAQVCATAVALLALAMVAEAQSVTVKLHSSNVAIDPDSFAFSFDADTLTIKISETWTQAGPGVVEISGLLPFSEIGKNYTVIKHFKNNTGITWTRLANELLDPSGDPNDSLDPLIQPGFVPTGYSTSNDNDGLSFAQVDATHPTGIARTSDVFAKFEADELSDNRDFLDFFDGSLLNGEQGEEQFGIRPGDSVNATTANQPFLIFQRENAFSVPPDGDGTGGGGETVPLPAAVWAGIAGIGAVVVLRKRAEKLLATRA